MDYRDLIKESKKYFGVIYKLTNTLNGKFYIGQTSNLHSRIKDYKYKKSNKKHNKYFMMQLVNEIGFNNFKFDILDTANNTDDLHQKEIYWINKLDSLNPEIGYNKKTGGSGGTMNEESKLLMSISSKNFRHTEEEKLRRSKKIIVFKDNHFKIFESAKKFGDYVSLDRTNVTYSIRHGTKARGYYAFYLDYELRNNTKINNKFYNELVELINLYVETIENRFFIIIK